MEIHKAYYQSPVGCIEVTGNSEGISSVKYLEAEPQNKGENPDCLKEAVRQLNEYFLGSRREFDLPIKAHGTDFEIRVWNELRTIPFGTTISYLDLAHKLGNKGAVRAVGHANGKNPVNIITPCHRVIGANGSLTGYGGGLWRKEWLLKFEKSQALPGLFQQIYR